MGSTWTLRVRLWKKALGCCAFFEGFLKGVLFQGFHAGDGANIRAGFGVHSFGVVGTVLVLRVIRDFLDLRAVEGY